MTAIPGDKIGSSNKQAKRKLRFHDRVQFKTIRHVSEFSEDEIKNGWYDKDDFNRMSDNVSDIAKLIGNGETSLNGEELCTRGLEHIVEEELADYRAEKMINSIDAVLDEQEEQWDEGKEEPGLIAELYAEYAKPLLREAHLIGLKDAEEGYKNWDDLFDQKEYHELTPQLSESPQLKAEKVATKKETKNVKKLVRKEKTGPSKTKVKKNKVKKSDDLSTGEKPSKTKKSASKSKVRNSKPQRNEEQLKPSSCTDLSLSSSSSSLQSSTSLPMSPRTSSMSLVKNQNSISSINSFTLRDASSRSILEEINTTGKDPMTKRSTMLKRNLPLSTKDEGQNGKNANSLSPKKQGKRSPRRSVSDRKHGTELSPFVFRRDGTLAFRKPDVEKLKREQKEKRKSFVEHSLTKFLQCDEEGDILAGILSGVGK